MRVTWERNGGNNKVAGRPLQRAGLPRKKIQTELPTCERPSRSSYPFVPLKDLLAGLVTSGDHHWRKTHVLWKGEKRGSDRRETINTKPVGSRCGPRGWLLSACVFLLPQQPRVVGGVVWKHFKRVRGLWRRQITTATTTYGSQQLNVFCQW